jgi:DNA-binding ferritin-like protein
MVSRKSEKRGRKTRRTKLRKNKSIRKIDNKKKSHIVRVFLEMLNTVKLYHWKTHSFAQHKATDELYERLNGNVDKFVETLLGKDESRIKMVEKRCELLDFSGTSDFKERVYEYRDFLVDMNRYFDAKRDTDLLNIRDEILGDINQFLYLMTFR